MRADELTKYQNARLQGNMLGKLVGSEAVVVTVGVVGDGRRLQPRGTLEII